MNAVTEFLLNEFNNAPIYFGKHHDATYVRTIMTEASMELWAKANAEQNRKAYLNLKQARKEKA